MAAMPDAGPARPPPAAAMEGTRRGAGIVGGESVTGILHPALGAVWAAADIIGPLAIALILLAAILLGSDQTCERVFRLLRWAANRPEPKAPENTPGSPPAPRTAPVTPGR